MAVGKTVNSNKLPLPQPLPQPLPLLLFGKKIYVCLQLQAVAVAETVAWQ